MIRPLKQEALDSRRIVIEVIMMLPRDVKPRLCATHCDAECRAVDWTERVALALPRLAVVKALCNVDTGCRSAPTLIRCNPHTPAVGRTVPLELDDEEWIY